MPRFFITPDNINEENATAAITGDDARHIARSLRMAEGDEVTVCDGCGTEYICTLSRIRDDECRLNLIEKRPATTEPKTKITLLMAYPKGDKLETVIQKAVELGACRIVPFTSSRCVKRPSEDKAEAKTKRLNKIAEEAAKQCGRGIIPTVSVPTTFEAALKIAAEASLPIFCYEADGAKSLKAILDTSPCPESISVTVGSEGGFSEAEALAAENAGLILANLGPRILRCETAPDYALSSISYKYEL
jgi:16S rRNA (uracil1498-N3)-methyltransferase